MVLTTLMIGFVVFRIWRWRAVFAVPIYAVLLSLDLGLFAASATKFTDGGWLPVGIAVIMVVVFTTWRRGRKLLAQRLAEDAMSVELLAKSTANVPRIAATAVYLTSSRSGVPPALLHNLKANHVLHARILFVTIETALTPRVDAEARLSEESIGPGLTRVVLRYGFSEAPNVPEGLSDLSDGFEPVKSSYFLSRQTLIPTRQPGMALWREHLFAAMMRNSQTPMSYFKLPINQVIELGSQVEI